MAIREFGESLLQDVRKRKDKQASALRKRQRTSDLLGLGALGLMHMGKSKLTSQWDNFNKNSDVLNTNIMINSAEKTDTNLTGLQTKITTSGLSTNEYFTNQGVDETLNKLLLKEENIKYNKDDASRKTFKAAFAPQIRNLEDIKTAATASVTQYEDALANQTKFQASGTKEDARALAKSKLGTRLTGLINQSGKQQAAVDEFRNGLYAKSAGSLAIFDKVLKETGGDFTSAIQLSEDFKLDANLLEQLDTKGSSIQNLSDGRVAIIPTTTSPSGEVTYGEHVIKDFRDEKTQVLAQLGKFNAGSELKETITDVGISEMLSEEQGFTMSPKTQIELDKNNELYDQYYLSHRLPTVSKAEAARRLEKRAAEKTLQGTEAWEESVGTLFNANVQIAGLKNNIKDSNPEATEDELEKLYSADKNIRIQTQEIAIIIAQQEQAMQSIADQYPPVDTDDAEIAINPEQAERIAELEAELLESQNNTNTNIKVLSATSDNISTDSTSEDDEEEVSYNIVGKKNKYGSQGLGSISSLASLLDKVRSNSADKKIERAAYNKMNRAERIEHRKTGVYPPKIQKMIDEGTIK